MNDLFARGRAAHPDLDLDREAFARHLARFAAVERSPAISDWAEDLYLACACAAGVDGAASTFERRFGQVIRNAVARVLAAPADRDEAAQLTRAMLLVARAGAPPKIASYSGQGPLENWVSVTAIRAAISFGRSGGTERQLRDRTVREMAGGADPEIRKEVEAAFGLALEQLEDRERLLLRLYLVSGMTMEDIGNTFGVGHQTISRWLVKSRKRVLAFVRSELARRLKISKNELRSLVLLVASQLNLSISRLLGPDVPPAKSDQPTRLKTTRTP
jgi:RNA polymerase sigma-70 factor (ECF subfamily)